MTDIIIQVCDIDGNWHRLRAEKGRSLMEVLYAEAIPGIVAECGGACACASCHVYIAQEWLDKLQPMDQIEDIMLDTAVERQLNSRLSCQLPVESSLAGMSLRVARNSG